MKNTFVLAAFFIPCQFAMAGTSSSPAQALQSSLIGDCVARGIQRQQNPGAVKFFCNCTWEAISRTLTVAEYIQMDSIVSSGGNPAALGSWSRLEPKIQDCKNQESNYISRP